MNETTCPQPRTSRERPAPSSRSERASATVEFVGALPLLAFGMLTCLQAMLAACSLVFAQSAADRAAHGASQSQARASVPSGWRTRTQVVVGNGRVRATVVTPAVLPGIGSRLVVHVDVPELQS
ncbi:MAG: hypothetical protein JWM90_1755 [Thermoleophilia bacterium]|nr:hypothetical protein [Thermoleophilia bacterium]